MPRIIIISNRLPVTINRKDGELFYYPSAGGLSTGLSSLDESIERLWIGWPGQAVEDPFERASVSYRFEKDNMVPVFLSQEDAELFYEGFSNKTIWPHFHYFTQYTIYEDAYWEAYQRVNQFFVSAVADRIQPGDIVWVHDYQLMLVPGLLREIIPNLSIGFFLHIPFPSYEIFRTLPWRSEILAGMLGADLIGFHTFGYMRHFLSAVYRITGHEHNFGKLNIGDRLVKVDAFPMGIDYEKYAAELNMERVSNEVWSFIDSFSKRLRLILSIDRLDYSKGVPQRLNAYEQFLREHPRYIEKVALVLVVVPSRSNVAHYKRLKEEVDEMVGRINGEFATLNWTPIRYYYRSFAFDDLHALYCHFHIALITPLRDGMNLIAKEFVASKEHDKDGVLILSEMAGAANELTEALLVNPNNARQIVDALVRAIEMPKEEMAHALTEMQKKLKKYNVKHWANNFIRQQIGLRKYQQERQTKLVNEKGQNKIRDAYQHAGSRLLLLDYDGTLVGFKNDPAEAAPDPELMNLLARIKDQAQTKMVIVSGRDRHTLGEWFGDSGIEMVSEHGVWLWKNQHWQLNASVSDTWKPTVRPVLENLVERTPGSFVEEKDYTMAWHYRKIDNELGANRVREIRDELIYLTANHDLQVLEGNKVVEIRNAGVNKGKAVSLWLNQRHWDFILAIGDDHTDEDTFQVLPPHAITIKVGMARTTAKFKVRTVEETRELLETIAQTP